MPCRPPNSPPDLEKIKASVSSHLPDLPQNPLQLRLYTSKKNLEKILTAL